MAEKPHHKGHKGLHKGELLAFLCDLLRARRLVDFEFQQVGAGVEQGEQESQQRADAAQALDDALVALDALLELAQAAGLSVAEELAHLRFQDREIGEDLLLEIIHNSDIFPRLLIGSLTH
jgi:hypothetical protein